MSVICGSVHTSGMIYLEIGAFDGNEYEVMKKILSWTIHDHMATKMEFKDEIVIISHGHKSEKFI